MNEQDWRLRAACRGGDVHDFFPPSREDLRQAVGMLEKFCDTCPVQQICLQTARAAEPTPATHHVIGGRFRAGPSGSHPGFEYTSSDIRNVLWYRARGGSGPCPECGRRQRLRHNGGVYQHWNPALEDWCPGSGELPTREAAS